MCQTIVIKKKEKKKYFLSDFKYCINPAGHFRWSLKKAEADRKAYDSGLYFMFSQVKGTLFR